MEIAICDDNYLDIEKINVLLQGFLTNRYNVYDFTDGIELLRAIKGGKSYNIIFLDIVLKRSTGIRIGALINNYLPDAHIIFVTEDINFCQDVHLTSHTYFLLKPISRQDFKNALKRTLTLMRQEKDNYMYIETKQGKRKVYFKGIQYIESDGRKIKIYLDKQMTITQNRSLSDMENDLPNSLFIRCHQSFIVNAKKVILFKSDEFILENARIPISRRYRQSAKREYEDYLLWDG